MAKHSANGSAPEVRTLTLEVALSARSWHLEAQMNQGIERPLPKRLVVSGVLVTGLLLWAMIAVVVVSLVRLAF